MNELAKDEYIYPGQTLSTTDCNNYGSNMTAKGFPHPYETEDAKIDTKSNNKSFNISPTNNGQRVIHIVRENETLDMIARKYKTTEQNLRYLNNLEKGEIVLPTQRLFVR